jgi:hypothetical protein
VVKVLGMAFVRWVLRNIGNCCCSGLTCNHTKTLNAVQDILANVQAGMHMLFEQT